MKLSGVSSFSSVEILVMIDIAYTYSYIKGCFITRQQL